MNPSMIWRQQHYNNSCACACVAMLLAHLGVDKQDDDVITETQMPWRLEYQPKDHSFTAGVMMQSDEVFTGMLLRHQLMLTGTAAKTWDEFLAPARAMLAGGEPFVTTFPAYHIPSPGYDPVRQQGDKARRHAIVVYAGDDQQFSVLDPLGGLDRTKAHQYQNVRSQVDLAIPLETFRTGMESSERPYLISHLAPWNGKRGMPLIDLLKKSREALDAFGQRVDAFAAETGQADPSKHGDILYQYLSACFKPIALDWRTAIEAQKGKTKVQFDLLEQLYTFQDIVIRQQKQMRESPSIGPEFHTELKRSAEAIIALGRQHLSSSISLK